MLPATAPALPATAPALRAECADLRARLAECEARLAECEAREALGGDVPLTLAQVALLAGMAIGSVRNAAHPKAPARLATFTVRGSTYVHASEARRWLAAGRRKAL